MNCNCCQTCFKEIKKFVIERVVKTLEEDSQICKKNFNERIENAVEKLGKNMFNIDPCNLDKIKEDETQKDFALCIKRAIKTAKESL